MTEIKMDKVIAGYHMLVMLSEVDGNFANTEGQVIVNYMKKHFHSYVSLDKEIEYLSILPKTEYATHFTRAAMDFYDDSDKETRDEFMDFAHQLVKADFRISADENIYINLLHKLWRKAAKS